MTVTYFDTPYYDGSGSTDTIVPPPWPFEVSIAGHNYVVDTSFEPYRRDAFRHRSIAPQRQSINFDNVPGEGTINTAGTWRRSMDDWSLGAGQIYLDRKTSVDNRFYRSKGVNPWTQWQLSLLNSTKQQQALAGSKSLGAGVFPNFVRAIAVSNYVYILVSNALVWTKDWVNFVPVAGLPTDGVMSGIATDGYNVYVSCYSGGIYQTVSGTRVSTHYITSGSFNSIGYCNDRLMAASGPKLFNITHAVGSVTLTAAVTQGTGYSQIAVTALPQNVRLGDPIQVGSDVFFASDPAAEGDVIIFVNFQVALSTHAIGDKVFDQKWSTPDVPLFVHNNPAWIWDCYAGGSSQIYIGGHSTFGGYSQSVNGGASGIYRTTLGTDGTTLNAPVIALPLEGGEFVTCLASYLNFIFVGTNLGVRMCQTLAAYDPTGNQGDLRAGPLIPNVTQPVTLPVTGIVGSGRFVWFTWCNYDTTSTGLGRLDLTSFIDALAPAYASDLMIDSDGPIFLDWDPINQGPLLALQGTQTNALQSSSVLLPMTSGRAGVYTLDPLQVVPSGTVESGYIVYDLMDPKVAVSLQATATTPGIDVPATRLGGPPAAPVISAQLASDGLLGLGYERVGNAYAGEPIPIWPIANARAVAFQVELQLNRFYTTPSTPGWIPPRPVRPTETQILGSPVLSRWTLKALPGVATGIQISAVLQMSRLTEEKSLQLPYDPYEEYEYLESLRQTQQVVQYVEGPFVRDVVITQLDWLPNLEQDGGSQSGYNTDLIVYMESF